jgi:hypothetical protein
VSNRALREVCAVALALVAGSHAAPAGAADACTLSGEGRRAQNAAGSQALVYRFSPAELKTDRHFSLLIETCPLSAAAELRVDAMMPAHRHGMNYRPTVTREGPGRWRADGLLLHMPGEWQFRFDLREDGRTERLTDTLVVG